MKLTETHRRALHDVLNWRRDVRHFLPNPVEDETLHRLRDSMNLAPSVGNSRPWRVVDVRDNKIRARVIKDFEDANRAAAHSYEAKERTDYLSLKLAGLYEAPVHLAVFTELQVEEGRGLGRQTMPETLTHSTVMAIHTLWLAARAENIGMGWVSILHPEAIAALLDVPETWSLTGYLCLGYPEIESDTPLLHEAGWQENKTSDWLVK